MKVPSVLIFTTIYEGKDYCLNTFLEHCSKLRYPNKRHIFVDNSKTDEYSKKLKGMGLEVYHVERGNNTREALARSSNFARNMALEEGYDYLMSLESDVMVPPETIEGLLTWGKDVVTGLYYIGDRKKNVRVPCITVPEQQPNTGFWGTRLLKPEEWPQFLNQGLKQVQAGGFGCCLIHKNVLKKVKFYYDPRFNGHPDIYFFNEVRAHGITTWVDTNCICDHQNSNWLDVEDR